MQKLVIATVAVFMYVTLSVAQANAADQPSVTNQPKTAAPIAKNPPAAVAPPQGVIINRLQAQPGFVFEVGPSNQVMARKVGGGPGGLGASASCGCTGTAGSCTLTVTGGLAVCSQDSDSSCNGLCTFTTTQPSFSGGAIAR
jgi:hypothetical protein